MTLSYLQNVYLVLEIVASLTSPGACIMKLFTAVKKLNSVGPRGVIYERNIFMIQATDLKLKGKK
jgi:hypothetical protein